MNRLYSILGAAAVIAIAVVFIVQFRPATNARSTAGPTCVAEVHGTCIPTNVYWAAYRLIAGPMDAAHVKAMGLRRLVAEGLVETELLNEDAKRLGITVSEDDINREITRGRAHVSLPVRSAAEVGRAVQLGDDMVRLIPVKAKAGGNFDVKTYEREIRIRTKLSPTDFRAYQRRELVAARMREFIRARVRVGDTEAFDRFMQEKTTARLDYVRLDKRFFADVSVNLSHSAVDAWINEHKDDVDKSWETGKAQYAPECRVTRVIEVSVKPTDGPEAKEKAKAYATRALDRVKAGEDFAAVAHEMSTGPSALRGGDVGCVGHNGFQDKGFEDAVFKVDAGKVSDVVDLAFGYFVIKVDQVLKGEELDKTGRWMEGRNLYASMESERITAEAGKAILGAVRAGKPLQEALDTELALVVRQEAAPAPKAEGGDEHGDKGDKKKHKKHGGKGGKKDEASKDEPTKDDGDKAAAAGADEHKPFSWERHPGKPTIDTTLPFTPSGDPIGGVRGVQVAKIAFSLKKPGDVPDDLVPLDVGYAVIVLKDKTPVTKEEWTKNREAYMQELRFFKEHDAIVAYAKRLQNTLGAEGKLNEQVVSDPKGGNTPDQGGDEE